MYSRRASALNGAVRCNATLYVETFLLYGTSYPHSSQITYEGEFTTFDASQKLIDSDSNDRKNLYVLNIPLDMTSDEFRDLFIPFGTVTHAVILA